MILPNWREQNTGSDFGASHIPSKSLEISGTASSRMLLEPDGSPRVQGSDRRQRALGWSEIMTGTLQFPIVDEVSKEVKPGPDETRYRPLISVWEEADGELPGYPGFRCYPVVSTLRANPTGKQRIILAKASALVGRESVFRARSASSFEISSLRRFRSSAAR